MAKMNPPESFCFDRPSQWPEWKKRFQRYRLASKLIKENGEVQVATLVYCMGSEAENVYKTFDLSDDDQKNVLRVLEKLDNHFVPKRNIIHERPVFNQRVQKQGETMESFVRSLYELSEHCNFGEQKNDMIKDRGHDWGYTMMRYGVFHLHPLSSPGCKTPVSDKSKPFQEDEKTV